MEKKYTMKELVEMINGKEGEFCINILFEEVGDDGQTDES